MCTIVMDPIIEAKNITKSFGDQQILKGISLSINEGEDLAIIGESGSGKSTLLHILGCMDKPTTGEILVNGRETRKLSKNELADLRNNYFGFVFQFFYLEPHLKIKENLEIPLFLKRQSTAKNLKKAEEIASLVGISDLLDKYPRQLSGGQQQRVAIGRALINNPRVIFLDEPTGNLDSKNSEKIVDLLDDLRSRTKVTTIMVTHDQKIANHSSRIIRIKDGEIC